MSQAEIVDRAAVSAADLQTYERDGVVLLKGLIGKDWLDKIAAGIAKDKENPSPWCHGYAVEGGSFFGDMRLWQHLPEFRDYCFNSPLPALAAQFLGEDEILLYYDQLFVKDAGANAPTRWHNDQPYWSVRGWPVISFWLTLDPVDAGNGRLEFVRGSHRWGKWYQPEAFAPGKTAKAYARHPDYETVPDIENNRDAYDLVAFDMEPGDVLAFHSLTLHGATPRNERGRRGYTVRYIGANNTWYRGDEPAVTPGLINEELKPNDRLHSTMHPLVSDTRNGKTKAYETA